MVWTFDNFRPGAEIGCAEMQVPDDALLNVAAAFPDLQPGENGPELTIATLMRAYTFLIYPRPPGNIHAEQTMKIFRQVRPGQTFVARATCLDKEIKKGRNWVVFGIELADGGKPLVEAEMRFVWAM
ncbi:hypothetical protein [Roseibium aggregatum]|uniref:Acyl dehydratase n=1 Tax=Roseibium aggregatum TaxID=187304 RepID=A0A939EJU9_9HYPH|nr:hypothetical protein [Roseibium aggregatum]MBN9673000.1 hypothetical protein [Roseibium aggregatum]